MLLGASRLIRRILVVVGGLWAILNLAACGGSKAGPPSGFQDRVLASQSVTSTVVFGGLVILNGYNDSIPGIRPLSAGTAPGLMAISPARNIVTAFDSGSNTVFAVNTTSENSMGQVRLPGPTFSMSVPTSSPVGYAAVPDASVPGFPVLGAVEVMNLSAGSITTTIGVSNPQTVVPTSDGNQLLVFSNDSDTVTLLTPARALPGVDLSCSPAQPNPVVCFPIPGFDRPVFAIVNQNTAYVLNCGAECGGTQASVQVVDLSTPIPALVGAPIPVNGATYALLSGTNLYVAGNGTPTGPLCASLPNAAPTQATYCGTLDIVNLNTNTDPYFNNPTMEIAIPDGYHNQLDMSIDGQLFVGSHDCTNIGNAVNPTGEVRGCLAILNTNTGAEIIPPENGDVTGLQSFTSREVEYVAEGGQLFVYDTQTDVLLITDYIEQGTINIVGYVDDIKAIDFF
jgi:DNA-binding beta-propeller fold protein YncE